jgi:ABC-type bacteriocin/lantibiotic exporter with double-glycine peptidase domain
MEIDMAKKAIRKINLVHQKHILGCFPACLAMVLGKTYNEALEIVHPNRKKYSRCSTTLIRAVSILRETGVKFKQPVANIELNKLKTSILFLENMDDDLFHAVIWDSDQKNIFDPWYYTPQDFKLYEDKAYLAIELK